MIKCPSCGAPNDESAHICVSCRSVMPAIEADPATEETGRTLLEFIGRDRRRDAVDYMTKRLGIDDDLALGVFEQLRDLPRTRPYTRNDIEMAIRMARRPHPFQAIPRSPAPRPISPALGCFGLMALMAACILLMSAMSMTTWRISGAYRQAMTRVRADPNVSEIFGLPVDTQFGFWVGSAGGGNGWNLRFDAPLAGPRRSGNMQVRANTTGSYFDEGWNVRITITYDADGQRQSFVVR